MSFGSFAERLVLGAGLVAACLTPLQSDVFWDLRAGGSFWHSGHVVTRELWSSTARGRYWPNHEWLWQALAYPVHAVGGMPVLVALNAGLAVLALVLSRRLGPPSRNWGAVALALAVATASAEWALRPQVASMVFFVLTLTWLSRERFWLLPLLFVVWANVHAGVAIGGVAVVATTVLAALRWLSIGGPAERARFGRLVLLTVLCAAATLLTPLGWRLWSYLLSARGNPSYRINGDWQTAFHLGPLEVAFWAGLVAVLAVVVIRRARFNRWHDQTLAVVAAMIAPLTMIALRNIAFFVLAALPVVLVGVAEKHVRANDHVPRARTVMTVLAALSLALVALVWWRQPPRLGWEPVTPSAAAAIETCPGRLYNTFALGGPVLSAVPNTPVFIDNRIDPYPSDLVLGDARVETTGRYREWFNRYSISCAVVEPGAALDQALLRDGWSARYRDATVSVLVPPMVHADAP